MQRLIEKKPVKKYKKPKSWLEFVKNPLKYQGIIKDAIRKSNEEQRKIYEEMLKK